jgi:hypothetical protein
MLAFKPSFRHIYSLAKLGDQFRIAVCLLDEVDRLLTKRT